MSKNDIRDAKDESSDVIIYSNNEERVKLLGNVLGGDTSRRILLLLTNTEMTASELAEDVGLSLSLTAHHLENMQNAGLVRISKIAKNSKNHDMKYYRAVSVILIFPKEASGKANTSKRLPLLLKKITRFSVIGITGLSSWLATKYAGVADVAHTPITEPSTTPSMDSMAPESSMMQDTALMAPESSTIPPTDSMAPELFELIASEPLLPIVVGLGTIILGLIIERVLVYAKK